MRQAVRIFRTAAMFFSGKRNMKRRDLLIAGAAVLAAGQASAEEKKKKVWPKVPAEWYGEGVWNDLTEKGTGVVAPGPEGRPVAYIAFDTQCPWCEKLHRALEPLYRQVKVVWFPVAVLNVNSEPQGSMILSAEDPWKKFLEHEDHFLDAEFRGLKVDQKEVWKLDPAIRQKVWENSKIMRRNGTRTIPYGVFKTPDGQFVPIYSGMKTEELRKLFGLPE